MKMNLPTIDWGTFLMHQVPAVVILGVVCFILFKKLSEKDTELAAERKEVTVLYGKAIEAQTKGNELQAQLIKLIEKLDAKVDQLKDTVHDKL